jgi:hypothetical protein
MITQRIRNIQLNDMRNMHGIMDSSGLFDFAKAVIAMSGSGFSRQALKSTLQSAPITQTGHS